MLLVTMILGYIHGRIHERGKWKEVVSQYERIFDAALRATLLDLAETAANSPTKPTEE